MEPKETNVEDQNDLLKKMTKALQGNNVTHETFIAGVKMILNHVKGRLDNTDRNVNKIVGSIDDVTAKIKDSSEKKITALKKEMTTLHEKSVKELMKRADAAKGDAGVSPRAGIDFPTYKQVLEVIRAEVAGAIPAPVPGKDGSPDEPEHIRNKLLSLEGDERLSLTELGDFDALDKRIRRLETLPYRNGDAIASRAGRVQYYDLSSKLDGVTTTYALPAFWTVISVALSSSPNVLRNGIDFTIDSTLMKITFTNQIIPAAQLATGQTCVIVYQEA